MIQGYKHIPFPRFLVHKYLIIMGWLYPIDYDEVMSKVDAHLWQGTMKRELKSLISDIVWDLIETLEGIKHIGMSWFIRGRHE